MFGGIEAGRWGVSVGVLFVTVIALLSLDTQLKLQQDSATYITLARSISTGGGYRDLFLVDRPRHAQYPPVLPLLLAPLVQLRGFDVVPMKLLLVFMAAGAVALTGALFRELRSPSTV